MVPGARRALRIPQHLARCMPPLRGTPEKPGAAGARAGGWPGSREGSCRAEPHSYVSGLETSALCTVPPVVGAQASCSVGRDAARSSTSVGGGSRPEMREGDRLHQDTDGRVATSSAACLCRTLSLGLLRATASPRGLPLISEGPAARGAECGHEAHAPKSSTGSKSKSPLRGHSSSTFRTVASSFSGDKGILPEIPVLEAGETPENVDVVSAQDDRALRCPRAGERTDETVASPVRVLLARGARLTAMTWPHVGAPRVSPGIPASRGGLPSTGKCPSASLTNRE